MVSVSSLQTYKEFKIHHKWFKIDFYAFILLFFSIFLPGTCISMDVVADATRSDWDRNIFCLHLIADSLWCFGYKSRGLLASSRINAFFF